MLGFQDLSLSDPEKKLGLGFRFWGSRFSVFGEATLWGRL